MNFKKRAPRRQARGPKIDDTHSLSCCRQLCNRVVALRLAATITAPFSSDGRSLWVELAVRAEAHRWRDLQAALARVLWLSFQARRRAALLPESPCTHHN